MAAAPDTLLVIGPDFHQIKAGLIRVTPTGGSQARLQDLLTASAAAGTVKSIATGAGLTGGTITVNGTIDLAPVFLNAIWLGSGMAGAPTALAPSSNLGWVLTATAGAPVWAAPATDGNASMTPLGYENMQAITDASAFPSVPDGATKAFISVSGAAIRWRDDGTDPTTALGMPAQPGSQITYLGDMTKIRFIEVSAGAVLDISFYK